MANLHLSLVSARDSVLGASPWEATVNESLSRPSRTRLLGMRVQLYRAIDSSATGAPGDLSRGPKLQGWDL